MIVQTLKIFKICSFLAKKSIDPIRQRMRCTWPETQTIDDRGRRKDVSQTDKKIATYLHFRTLALISLHSWVSWWEVLQVSALGARHRRNSVFRSDAVSSCEFPQQRDGMQNAWKIQTFYRGPTMSHGYFSRRTLSLVTCQVTEKSTEAIAHSWSSSKGDHGARSYGRSRLSLLPPVIVCLPSVDRIMPCEDEFLSWT